MIRWHAIRNEPTACCWGFPSAQIRFSRAGLVMVRFCIIISNLNTSASELGENQPVAMFSLLVCCLFLFLLFYCIRRRWNGSIVQDLRFKICDSNRCAFRHVSTVSGWVRIRFIFSNLNKGSREFCTASSRRIAPQDCQLARKHPSKFLDKWAILRGRSH
jgi:hypothetical protein